jgi:hypothetical protein
MKKEEPLVWMRDRVERKVTPQPGMEDHLAVGFEKSSPRLKGWMIIGLAAMWLLGEAGCYLAGLALHETAHVF